MKPSIEQIKNEVAVKDGFENFEQVRTCMDVGTLTANTIEDILDEVATEYARQMCDEQLRALDLEIFKPIPGYEGLYEVSNHGRVKSLLRFKNKGFCKNSPREERIIINQINAKGYPCVILQSEKGRKGMLVHRLVMMAHEPNPENKPHVNHIDRNPLNARLDNLEWCTASENMQHSVNLGVKFGKGRNVIDTETSITYESIKDACHELNLDYSTMRKMMCGMIPNTTSLVYKDSILNTPNVVTTKP